MSDTSPDRASEAHSPTDPAEAASPAPSGVVRGGAAAEEDASDKEALVGTVLAERYRV